MAANANDPKDNEISVCLKAVESPILEDHIFRISEEDAVKRNFYSGDYAVARVGSKFLYGIVNPPSHDDSERDSESGNSNGNGNEDQTTRPHQPVVGTCELSAAALKQLDVSCESTDVTLTVVELPTASSVHIMTSMDEIEASKVLHKYYGLSAPSTRDGQLLIGGGVNPSTVEVEVTAQLQSVTMSDGMKSILAQHLSASRCLFKPAWVGAAIKLPGTTEEICVHVVDTEGASTSVNNPAIVGPQTQIIVDQTFS